MVRFISEEFAPVEVHVRNQAEEFKRLGSRYGVQWTPTELVIDSSGVERHRVEGFLPVQDFLAQLELGLAQAEFAQSKFAEAERRYREVVERYPETERSIGLGWRATRQAETAARCRRPQSSSKNAIKTRVGLRRRRSGHSRFKRQRARLTELELGERHSYLRSVEPLIQPRHARA